MQVVIKIPENEIPTKQDIIYVAIHFIDGKIVECDYPFIELEQEPCEDAISRQAVLDTIGNVPDHDDGMVWEALSHAQRDVALLPPVTPQPKTDWIPVSKRMPEEHEWMGTKKFGTTISDEVYVMLENSEGRRYTQHLSFQNGKLSTADQSRLDVIFKGGTPIAWMPLPKPYEAESEE